MVEYTHLIKKIVEFTPRIEEMEAYAETGIRARILSITAEGTSRKELDEHIYIIKFDYSEFDEFNTRYETANYYDKNGVPCLTARQSGFYNPQEKIYFGTPLKWPFEDYFNVVDSKTAELIKKFKESGAKSYVEWLESQVQV